MEMLRAATSAWLGDILSELTISPENGILSWEETKNIPGTIQKYPWTASLRHVCVCAGWKGVTVGGTCGKSNDHPRNDLGGVFYTQIGEILQRSPTNN